MARKDSTQTEPVLKQENKNKRKEACGRKRKTPGLKTSKAECAKFRKESKTDNTKRENCNKVGLGRRVRAFSREEGVGN